MLVTVATYLIICKLHVIDYMVQVGALLVCAFEAREAKIANFDVVFGIEQHVLGLQIPMY